MKKEHGTIREAILNRIKAIEKEIGIVKLDVLRHKESIRRVEDRIASEKKKAVVKKNALPKDVTSLDSFYENYGGMKKLKTKILEIEKITGLKIEEAINSVIKPVTNTSIVSLRYDLKEKAHAQSLRKRAIGILYLELNFLKYVERHHEGYVEEMEAQTEKA